MCEHSHMGVLTPFADERLVQYVYNVPWEMKFMGGREKGLLREAAGALLPESLRYRRKSPYPKTCDPAYARIVCGMVQGMLAEKKDVYKRQVVGRVRVMHAAGNGGQQRKRALRLDGGDEQGRVQPQRGGGLFRGGVRLSLIHILLVYRRLSARRHPNG